MTRLSFISLLTLLTFTTISAVSNNLSCYQCLVASNDLCTEDDMKPCPNDQAYDVCVTILKKNAKEGFHIEKKCGLRPCNLDSIHTESLGLDHCDRSQEDFVCMTCCHVNGCNKDGGNVVRAALALVLTCAFVISFFS